MLSKIFSKKDSGIVVTTVIETTLCVLFCTILLMFAVCIMGTLQRKSDVDLVCRKYILMMETEGCLTADTENALKDELTALGVAELDLTGTTKSEVSGGVETKPSNYGEVINLHIKGKIKLSTVTMTGSIGSLSNLTLDVDMTKSSISKH